MIRSSLVSVLLAAFAISLVPACASKPHTVKIQEDTPNKRTEVIAIRADNIRSRRGRFDMHFLIKNNHAQAIQIKASDFNCYRGTFAGEIAYSTADGNISFEPGEERGFNIHCTHSKDATGDYKITVTKVYDSAGKNKILADSVAWSAKGD